MGGGFFFAQIFLVGSNRLCLKLHDPIYSRSGACSQKEERKSDHNGPVSLGAGRTRNLTGQLFTKKFSISPPPKNLTPMTPKLKKKTCKIFPSPAYRALI